MKKCLLCISAFLLLLSCKHNDKYSKIHKAEWLVGSWSNTSADETLTEIWEKLNDSVFAGQAFVINEENDTIFFEHIRLEETKGEVFYIVTVPDQNDGQAVPFKMTAINDSLIVFENPEHDYPQKIAYRKVNADSLIAEISGKPNGIMQSEKFPMKKKD
ncbi:hypothetical protein KJK34_02820 [Flavobacterium sp. D11R37]|uniref:DUF6265 family protein n=1 Tax=Flavobacterium coralii TaxID=2838017 RepID=UPI001CA60BDC|nr:DUF6265 family protein [Flavobacterium coralii]MBY8961679.1 hypothetical protein [Flavobacterium coralii]